MSDSETSINLNKFISDTGICSRRAAEKFILEGRVKINGQPTQLGNRVKPGDVVTLDGKPLKSTPKLLYLAFNKPPGITCTTETHIPGNIISYINHPQRLFPIGRLDKESEGLIFLTNDGNIVNKILRAGNNHQKEYIVTVNKPISPEFIKRMAGGVPILDTVTQKCRVRQLSKTTFNIILTQGLNRQIRRMCEYLGYEVQKLVRIRIMNVSLGNLKKGEWRYLDETEMLEIQNLVADSKKTAD